MKDKLLETWLILFLAGLVLFNFPFIDIFNQDTPILGIPTLVLYLFLIWALFILVIYLFGKFIDQSEKKHSESLTEGDDE